ncbi:MAG: hypothetical protein ACLVL2_17100 [Bacteroides cellulosilyticus]
MKRIGITVALLFCMGTGSLFAQAYKVVEKSDKKAPVWYESAESGYIVASAETGSMEEALSAMPGKREETDYSSCGTECRVLGFAYSETDFR